MLQTVSKYIEKHKMILPGQRIVVGLSGGADSVALLHILKRMQETMYIELFAAHVNHGLRGQAARDDAVFAEELCKRWGIPFFLKAADVRALSHTLRRTEEEAGRMVRYGFFHEVMEKVNGDRIATAHHKNDQAETILHNVIRGSGMQGLTGIRPVRDGIIIRPLLDVSRQEIEDYLIKHQLSYREDASNADPVYTRNRIRNRLLPVLAEHYNPDIVDSLTRMAGILRDEDDFLTGHCSSLYEAYAVSGPGQIRMDLKKFKACHPALQRRLVRMAVADLRGNLVNVGSSHIEAVIRLASRSATGARTLIPADSLSGREIWAELSYDFLVFRRADDKQPASAFDCLLPVPGQVRLEELNLTVTAEKWDQNKGLPFSPRCIYIDGEKIKGELRLRQRRDGDRFRPLGMQGRKKLKDYFIDRKIPREQRNRIPLLTDGENIIWVVGFHMSQDYRITERTRRIVKISLQYHADGG